MQLLIPIALLGWIPLSISLLALLPPRRAVVASFIGAWLLLPPASIPLSGLPDYDKMMAATVGILLGTLIFQPNRLLEFRPQWFDLPMLCWCIAPLISSLQNGLGLYDGLSGSLGCIVRWALPYLIGRLYLGEPEGLRELTIGTIFGGVAYVPAILLELRLSPFLKGLVYGMYQWEGARYGAYRPFVFLTTGLELGMWMTAVSLTAVWIWRCGVLKRIGALPFGTFVMPTLLVVTVLCRSGGALILLLGGLILIWSCTRFNSKLLFYALLLAAPVYYSVRIPNFWSGDDLVNVIETLDADRAQSLGYRFYCENLLIRRAMQQPLWGWGGWGRNRVVGPDGRDMAVTDGMWIIYLGTFGCFGLFSWTTVLLLPPWLFLVRYPVRQWKTSHGRPYGGHRCASWSLCDRLLGEWLLKLRLRCGFRRIDLYAADEFQAEDIDPGFQRTWPAPLVTQIQVELWASQRPNHAGRPVCRSNRSRNATCSRYPRHSWPVAIRNSLES